MLEEIMSIVRNQKMQVESHEMEIQATSQNNQMTNEDDEIIWFFKNIFIFNFLMEIN